VVFLFFPDCVHPFFPVRFAGGDPAECSCYSLSPPLFFVFLPCWALDETYRLCLQTWTFPLVGVIFFSLSARPAFSYTPSTEMTLRPSYSFLCSPAFRPLAVTLLPNVMRVFPGGGDLPFSLTPGLVSGRVSFSILKWRSERSPRPGCRSRFGLRRRSG